MSEPSYLISHSELERLLRIEIGARNMIGVLEDFKEKPGRKEMVTLWCKSQMVTDIVRQAISELTGALHVPRLAYG